MRVLRKDILSFYKSLWLTVAIILGCFEYCYSQVANLYHFAESLPPSISNRDYSRFKSEEDVIVYRDSCLNAIEKIGEVKEENLAHYAYLAIEIHDMLDQFPKILGASETEASEWIIKLLKAIENIQGYQGNLYAKIFAEYLVYDCRDSLMKLVDMVGQDLAMLNPEISDYMHYRLNRNRDVYDGAANVLFELSNNESKRSIKGWDAKELLWLELLLESNANNSLGDRAVDIILANYNPIEDSDKFIKSIELRQQFMDGTGLLLSILANNSDNDFIERNRECTLNRIGILEKSFISLSGKVRINKHANGVHVLAYLQAWRNFIISRNADKNELSKLDSISSEFISYCKPLPASYSKAIDLLHYNYEESAGDGFISNSENNQLLEFLIELNSKIKKSELFQKVDNYLPPIIEWRKEELLQEKTYKSLLDYCLLALEYIDLHFDSSFPWFTLYDPEETEQESKEKSEKRRNLLYEQGWTGKPGDQLKASNNIIDYAIDYLISSKNYHLSSAPILLSRAAKIKYELGENASALLYAKMSNQLFNLLDLSPMAYIDNLCIILETDYSLNKQSKEYQQLIRVIPKMERKLESCNDESSYETLRDCFMSSLNTLTKYELTHGMLESADSLNNKALDIAFGRKDPILEKGGSIIIIPQPFHIPIRYLEWKIAERKGPQERADSVYNLFSQALSLVDLELPLHMENFMAISEQKYWSDPESRLYEDFEFHAIRDSKRIRDNILNFGASLNPNFRLRYYETNRSEIEIYNGILAHSDSVESAETIYNNLLMFHGLQLLNERLISNALSSDKECMLLLSEASKYNSFNHEKLIGLFKSDNYRRKLEEKALNSQNVKNLLSVSYKDIQNSLDHESVAVEFFRSPFWDDKNNPIPEGEYRWGYYAAVIKNNGTPQIIPLCSEDAIMSIPSQKRFSSNKLTDLIWTPIILSVGDVNKIFFSPDGELYNIPIENLPFDKTHLLVDKYEVFRLSSTREIIDAHPNSHILTAAIFGDMCYSPIDSSLNNLEKESLVDESYQGHLRGIYDYFRGERGTVEDLPATKIEIANISDELSRRSLSYKVYKGSSASEEQFKSLSGNSPSILHIATHGIYWTKNDLQNLSEQLKSVFEPLHETDEVGNALNRSMLLFSGANGVLEGKQIPADNDGIVTAQEVSELDLHNVDLLSLSACQTGLGDIQGDGVFGLQRGFKKAGVKSLLMSLWKVDDEATQIFMTAFYKAYLNGMSKIKALKSAQNQVRHFDGIINNVRRDFSNPKYWAGFILLDGMN